MKILMIVVMLSALMLLSACGSEFDNTAVAHVTTNDEEMALSASNEITVNGIVSSATTRNVYSSQNFTIERVYGEVGDIVVMGQVLAVLDTYNLELNIVQQKAHISQARSNSEVALNDARRRLSEAEANLANNTNIQIVNAQSALNSAESALILARMNYVMAQRDHAQGVNQRVLNAESVLRTATVELERIERDYSNDSILYASGIISTDEMRRTQTALAHARNHYEESRTNYSSAHEQESRGFEHYRNALQSAEAAQSNAQAMLNASRTNARQEIERLRNNVANAEISANIEHMEIALLQLERNLEDATITSPIDGVITAVAAKEGAIPVGGGLLFTIEDTNNLEIVTYFREYDLARLYRTMEVSILPSGAGNVVYSGYISRISPAASPSPIVEFKTIVRVTSEDTNLRIGMTARVIVAAY